MQKFKLIYKLNEITKTKDLSKSEFDAFRFHIQNLCELRDILFRTTNFTYAEQYFNKNKDLKKINSEIELYNFILSTVAIIRMNIDSWSFYIQRNYQNNKLFFPASTKKSIFDEKCSYYYDNFESYAIVSNLRNLALHSGKVYSLFEFTKDDFKVVLQIKDFDDFNFSKSFKDILSKHREDYRIDIISCLNDNFKYLHELNNYIYKELFNYNYNKYVKACRFFKDNINSELDSPAIIWDNEELDLNSLNRVSIEYIPIDFMQQIYEEKILDNIQ